MAIFLVGSQNKNNQLSDVIKREYPDNFFEISSEQWLVSSDSLTKEVSDKLGITGGGHGRTVVFKIDVYYYGWHDKSLWEWLDLKNKR